MNAVFCSNLGQPPSGPRRFVRCLFPVLAGALAALHPVAALAVEEVKLQGTAFLDEEGCARGLQAKGCSLSFYVEGPAARLLYEGMAGKPRKEECTGGFEKTDGKGLHCLKYDDGTFACNFGYHFGGRGFAGSSMTC